MCCLWCILQRCGIAVQRAVSYCAAVGVLCSGVVLWYREGSVSVLFLVYCVAVGYCGTESRLLVCFLWIIV